MWAISGAFQKSNLIFLVFCTLGIWLVWEFRLLGLFIYAAILFCIRYGNVFPAGTMPKDKEKAIIWSMYGFTILCYVLAIVASGLGWLKPASIQIASSAMLPSVYDNAVILISSTPDQLDTLLANSEFEKRKRLLFGINLARKSGYDSKYLFYAVNLTSLAALVIFVILTSGCMFKSRLPHVDEGEILKMHARARLNVSYSVNTIRIIYFCVGIILLGIFFAYYIWFRIGLEDIDVFLRRGPRGHNLFRGLILQLFMQFILWNFARFPFSKTHKFNLV